MIRVAPGALRRRRNLGSAQHPLFSLDTG